MTAQEFNNKFNNENNYTAVIVQSNGFLHKPDMWNKAISNINFLRSYKNIQTTATGSYSSLVDVANAFNGYIYLNDNEFAFSEVLVPNENYTKFVNYTRASGFEVLKNTKMHLYLNDSRNSIGLPVSIGNIVQSVSLTGKNVKVGIIDSGANHSDINSKIYSFTDFTNEGYSMCCIDKSGHGTHVASIIAGSGAASGGKYSGIAPDVSLSIFRAFIGLSGDSGQVANAIQSAASSDVNIISFSGGETGTAEDCSGTTTDNVNQKIYQAIKKALSRNITVVVSAGNDGPDGEVSFPACINGVIAVGSAIKKDYANNIWYDNPGNDYHVNLEVDSASGATTYSYGLNGTSLHSSFQKLVQTNGQSQIKTSIKEQNLDWCDSNSNGDLTVACTNVKRDQATMLFDCNGDCRNAFSESPNTMCNVIMGSNWYATGLNCEKIDIDHIPDGNYTRDFDMIWNDDPSNQANGWCEDTGLKDMSITCTHLTSKPQLKVQVRECNGNCTKQGSPNQICRELGSDWHAISVDCETITVSGSSGSRSFDDNVGSWCQDGGHEDLTVTCERGNLLNSTYKTTILNCNGNCANKGTPDRICQNAYGSGWYSQFVDCEGMSMNDNFLTMRYLDASMSFPTSQNVDVDVIRSEGAGVNDIVVKFNNVNQLSTKGVVSDFSSRGPPPQDSNLIKPDVTAPGTDICAARTSRETLTSIGECSLSCGNNNYMSCSGTSMSAPMVTGSVALLMEAKPGATPTDVMNSIRKADLKMSSSPNMYEGYGFIDVPKAVNSLTNCSKITKYVAKGYQDSTTDPRQCSGYNYNSYSSANQVRNYRWSDSISDCDCSVGYDSYLSASVNGVSSGDVSILQSDNISVDVDVKNIGTQPQNNWYVGIEFWNISDYTKVLPGGSYDQYRSGRINAFYNGKDGTHGCISNPDKLHPTPDSCPSGVDCKIISESVNANGKLDVGETIRVRCQVPASFYPISTGNQRVMFWINEMDLSQDANNDGTVGSWWWDALSRIEASSVRAQVSCKIGATDSDGINYILAGTCTQYYQNGASCASTSYADVCTDANTLEEYYVSGNTCGAVFKACTDFGANYVCSNGACKAINCGTIGQPCCATGIKCSSGLKCCSSMNICYPSSSACPI